MKYEGIGVSITTECDISCSICCRGSKKQPPEKIDYVKAAAYIESSRDTSIEHIGFTGGEAFLYFDLLKNLVSLSNSLGKSSTVMTNGFWASDYSETENRLSELKKVGLTSFGLSYDEFHARLVETKKVKNIIRATKKVKLPLTIQTVMLRDSSIGDLFNKVAIDLDGVTVIFANCRPVGNALKNISEDKYIRTSSSRGLFCVKGGTFLVEHNGVIRPCCFPEISMTELVAGNMYKQDVQKTLQTLKNNAYLHLLRNYGFDYFINIVKENSLDIIIPDRVVSSCELCSLFFSKDNYYLLAPYVHRSIQKLKNNHIVS